MPLLEIVGMTCTGKTFNLGFAFLSKEDAPTYTWVLRQVETWCPRRPDVILTDRELGLLKAITIVYPDAHYMLCIVHVQRNRKNYSYSKRMSMFSGDKSSGTGRSCMELASPLI